MTQPGLLHHDLMHTGVDERLHPAPSLLPLLTDGLRRVGRALLEVADAMLAPRAER